MASSTKQITLIHKSHIRLTYTKLRYARSYVIDGDHLSHSSLESCLHPKLTAHYSHNQHHHRIGNHRTSQWLHNPQVEVADQ
jgi:hypothetical protein